jgi:diaminopimelate epimerase
MNGSMHPLANRQVIKMNGLGNEIVILDLRDTTCGMDAAAARAIGLSLPFDQLMVLFDPRTESTEAFVEIFNNDGSRAGACGNGTRCVAFVLCRDQPRNELVVETAAGLLECRRLDEWTFSVDMGAPRLAWDEIPVSHYVGDTGAVVFEAEAGTLLTAALVNMGNPHAVFFVDDLDKIDIASLGPRFERHEIFPERANISFAEVKAPNHISLKVWERGAGLTRACGSAACAALVAGVRGGVTQREARVSLPGGDLTVAWRATDGHVVMTGPVAFEFATRLDPSVFDGIAA